MTYFTKLEADTLERLYPDRAEWWTYWYALSDEVQERRGELAGEAMRLLWEWRQRPFRQHNGDHWWCATSAATEPESYFELIGWKEKFRNYLPGTILFIRRLDIRNRSPSAADLLDRFVAVYAEHTPEQRADFWANWIPKGVAA